MTGLSDGTIRLIREREVDFAARPLVSSPPVFVEADGAVGGMRMLADVIRRAK